MHFVRYADKKEFSENGRKDEMRDNLNFRDENNTSIIFQGRK
jgi:hypothetical protein